MRSFNVFGFIDRPTQITAGAYQSLNDYTMKLMSEQIKGKQTWNQNKVLEEREKERRGVGVGGEGEGERGGLGNSLHYFEFILFPWTCFLLALMGFRCPFCPKQWILWTHLEFWNIIVCSPNPPWESLSAGSFTHCRMLPHLSLSTIGQEENTRNHKLKPMGTGD